MDAYYTMKYNGKNYYLEDVRSFEDVNLQSHLWFAQLLRLRELVFE